MTTFSEPRRNTDVIHGRDGSVVSSPNRPSNRVAIMESDVWSGTESCNSSMRSVESKNGMMSELDKSVSFSSPPIMTNSDSTKPGFKKGKTKEKGILQQILNTVKKKKSSKKHDTEEDTESINNKPKEVLPKADSTESNIVVKDGISSQLIENEKAVQTAQIIAEDMTKEQLISALSYIRSNFVDYVDELYDSNKDKIRGSTYEHMRYETAYNTSKLDFVISKMKALIMSVFETAEFSHTLDDMTCLDFQDISKWTKEPSNGSSNNGILLKGKRILDFLNERIEESQVVYLRAEFNKMQDLHLEVVNLRKQLYDNVDLMFRFLKSQPPIYRKAQPHNSCNSRQIKLLTCTQNPNLIPRFVLNSFTIMNPQLVNECNSLRAKKFVVMETVDEAIERIRQTLENDLLNTRKRNPMEGSKLYRNEKGLGGCLALAMRKSEFVLIESALDGKWGSYNLFEKWLADYAKWTWIETKFIRDLTENENQMDAFITVNKNKMKKMIDIRLASLWAARVNKLRQRSAEYVGDYLSMAINTFERPLSLSESRDLVRMTMLFEDMGAGVRRYFHKSAHIHAKVELQEKDRQLGYYSCRNIEDFKKMVHRGNALLEAALADASILEKNWNFQTELEKYSAVILKLDEETKRRKTKSDETEKEMTSKKQDVQRKHRVAEEKLNEEKQRADKLILEGEQIKKQLEEIEELKKTHGQAKQNTLELKKELSILRSNLSAQQKLSKKMTKEIEAESSKKEKVSFEIRNLQSSLSALSHASAPPKINESEGATPDDEIESPSLYGQRRGSENSETVSDYGAYETPKRKQRNRMGTLMGAFSKVLSKKPKEPMKMKIDDTNGQIHGSFEDGEEEDLPHSLQITKSKRFTLSTINQLEKSPRHSRKLDSLDDSQPDALRKGRKSTGYPFRAPKQITRLLDDAVAFGASIKRMQSFSEIPKTKKIDFSPCDEVFENADLVEDHVAKVGETNEAEKLSTFDFGVAIIDEIDQPPRVTKKWTVKSQIEESPLIALTPIPERMDSGEDFDVSRRVSSDGVSQLPEKGISDDASLIEKWRSMSHLPHVETALTIPQITDDSVAAEKKEEEAKNEDKNMLRNAELDVEGKIVEEAEMSFIDENEVPCFVEESKIEETAPNKKEELAPSKIEEDVDLDVQMLKDILRTDDRVSFSVDQSFNEMRSSQECLDDSSKAEPLKGDIKSPCFKMDLHLGSDDVELKPEISDRRSDGGEGNGELCSDLNSLQKESYSLNLNRSLHESKDSNSFARNKTKDHHQSYSDLLTLQSYNRPDDSAAIAQWLQNSVLQLDFDADDTELIEEKMSSVIVEPGTTLISKGEAVTFLYVVKDGTVSIEDDHNKEVDAVFPGSLIFEEQFFSESKSKYNAVTNDICSIMKLARVTYLKVTEESREKRFWKMADCLVNRFDTLQDQREVLYKVLQKNVKYRIFSKGSIIHDKENLERIAIVLKGSAVSTSSLNLDADIEASFEEGSVIGDLNDTSMPGLRIMSSSDCTIVAFIKVSVVNDAIIVQQLDLQFNEKKKFSIEEVNSADSKRKSVIEHKRAKHRMRRSIPSRHTNTGPSRNPSVSVSQTEDESSVDQRFTTPLSSPTPKKRSDLRRATTAYLKKCSRTVKNLTK